MKKTLGDNIMTQEEKDLLKKVLCEMLPYDPFIKIGKNPNIFKLSQRVRWVCSYMKVENVFDDVKPYLRPMSSMTEEEIEKYHETCEIDDGDFTGETMYFPTTESWDYLNSIHIDYRNLILKGLALEAPENMYND